MELEKATEPQLLGGLYTLRGGLSALSVKYAQVKNFDSIYYQRLHSLADTAGGASGKAPDGTVEFTYWLQNGGFEKELINRYNSIEKYDRKEEISKCERQLSIAKSDAKKHYTVAFLMFLLSSAVISLLLFLIFGVKIFSDVMQKGKLAIILNVALLILVAGFPVIAPIVACISNLSTGSHDKACIKKEQKNLKELKKLDAEEDKRVQAAKSAAKANIDKLPHIREWAQRILDERNGLILPLIKYCNQYYAALYGEYKNFLDERDWKNLDLVIYEIETRRADSIKEALQLTDRELQTDRIVKTLGEATKAICYTVSRGFFELQNTVKICCDKICDKLDDISHYLENISGQMSVQSMQLAGISGQLANLTDAVNVGNCLQAKTNVTSAQLCNDVHALRNYS